MIYKLHLESYNKLFSQYKINGSEILDLTNLKRINVFVGANNSGKSRFLRELFHSFHKKEINNSKSYGHIDFPYIDIDKANEEFNLIIKSFKEVIIPGTNKEKEIEFINKFKERISEKLYKGKISFNEYTRIIDDFNFVKSGPTEIVQNHNVKHEDFIKKKKEELQNMTFSTYIPVLRSLKKLSGNPIPLITRAHEDYFKDLDIQNLNVFTGERLYDTIKVAKESPPQERKKIKEFEEFLGSVFFKSVFELSPLGNLGLDDKGEQIPNSNKDLYVKIGDDPEFPIYKIGDGIQALIMLTFPLFLYADKNHLLFIEEPELNLHPGLQRLFLEMLNEERFKNTQVFITTHSNHFLDLAIETSHETSIFSFEKKSLNEKGIPQFEICDITKRSVDALNLLGVNSSSVFLSNCTIWIEGISDRLFIRKYLDIYQSTNPDNVKNFPSFKEDIHYSFVEYAGNNIEHWSFLDNFDDDCDNINYQAISKNIFLITDKDKGKERRHKILEKNLGDNYYCLECLEIENLLKPEVLKETIKKYKKVNAKELKFKDFEFDDYKDDNIGEFIYSIITDENAINKIASKPRNGRTKKITYKYKFAKNATAYIKKWDDLSDFAQILTRRIYQFIKDNNKL